MHLIPDCGLAYLKQRCDLSLRQAAHAVTNDLSLSIGEFFRNVHVDIIASSRAMDNDGSFSSAAFGFLCHEPNLHYFCAIKKPFCGERLSKTAIRMCKAKKKEPEGSSLFWKST